MTKNFNTNFLLIVTKAITNAITPPIKGARKINNTTGIISSIATTLNPACATAAPAKPPIKVCEEEEGIPNHHVNKFHVVAANKPAKITHKSIAPLSTVFATVFPTLISNTQNAKTLKAAAHNTA